MMHYLLCLYQQIIHNGVTRQMLSGLVCRGLPVAAEYILMLLLGFRVYKLKGWTTTMTRT